MLSLPDTATVVLADLPPKRTPATVALALLQAMRPKQWMKNGTVFLPLLFSINQYWSPANSGQLIQLAALSLAASAVFCLLSSGEYLINDVLDREADRQHPRKRFRPIASGRLLPGEAVAAALGLFAVGLTVAYVLRPGFAAIGLAYVVLMLAYTFWLKHQVVLDVFVIAAGFVLRAVAGAVVIAVPISPWLYICTSLGALFLGLSKRRNELTLLAAGAGDHRPILKKYTPALVDEMIAVVTPSTVIAYGLYTFTAEGLPKNHAMMLTIPFVLYGIFRYLYLVHTRQQGGSPEEVLLTDLPLLADVVLWVLASAAILLLFRGQ